MFVLNHQDGDIEYDFDNGGFAIEDSKLYLSIETKVLGDEAFPDCFLFSIEGYPLNGEFKSLDIQLRTNPKDEPPNLHVYTTFHAANVEAEASIKVITDNEMLIAITVISDDVNYYDHRAKPNAFMGSTTLTRMSKRDLWFP